MTTLSRTIRSALAVSLTTACAAVPTTNGTQQKTEELSNMAKAVALLESFNTGDPAPVAYINPKHYTQHNLSAGDGLEGISALLKNAPPQGFRTKVHRAFADGDFVVTHTEYDFFGPKAGFDIFRFENGLIVEHWDNLGVITPPNPSGRTQFDGATEVTDLGQTAENKATVQAFVENVLIGGRAERIPEFVSTETYLQHNSAVADGIDGLGAALQAMAANGMVMTYDRTHKVLGQGNFVLTVSEGRFGPKPGHHVAFYDLFRLKGGKIVEHWDVIETIPPRSEWKNDNGKF